MKTKMNFGWLKSAIIVVVMLGALAVIILDIVMLAGVDGVRTASPAVAGVSMAAGVLLLIAACLILFNSYYRFREDAMLVVLGFFYDKLPYENISGIRENTVTKEIYVIYKAENDSDGEQSIRLNLSAVKSEKFLDELRKHCPFVIVEPFTPDKKKKK